MVMWGEVICFTLVPIKIPPNLLVFNQIQSSTGLAHLFCQQGGGVGCRKIGTGLVQYGRASDCLFMSVLFRL